MGFTDGASNATVTDDAFTFFNETDLRGQSSMELQSSVSFNGTEDTLLLAPEPGFQMDYKNHPIYPEFEITRPAEGQPFTFEFEISVGRVVPGWSNIIHLGNDNWERLPGCWFWSNSFKLHCCIASRKHGVGNTCLDSKGGRGIRTIKITVDSNDHFRLEDTGSVHNWRQRLPHSIKNVIGEKHPLYLSDPWYVASDVGVRNLKINNVPIVLPDLVNQTVPTPCDDEVKDGCPSCEELQEKMTLTQCGGERMESFQATPIINQERNATTCPKFREDFADGTSAPCKFWPNTGRCQVDDNCKAKCCPPSTPPPPACAADKEPVKTLGSALAVCPGLGGEACGTGWHVCTGGEIWPLQLTFEWATSFPGCYVVDAATDYGGCSKTCGSSENVRPGTKFGFDSSNPDSQGMGSGCVGWSRRFFDNGPGGCLVGNKRLLSAPWHTTNGYCGKDKRLGSGAVCCRGNGTSIEAPASCFSSTKSYKYGDIVRIDTGVGSPADCQARCAEHASCALFVFDSAHAAAGGRKLCWLKSAVGSSTGSANGPTQEVSNSVESVSSGPKVCP